MLESLRALSAPLGGDLFLLIAAFCLLSYLAFVWWRARMSVPQLRRLIRVAALMALPLSWFAMQQGESYLTAALLPLAWCVVIGISCKNEITRKS